MPVFGFGVHSGQPMPHLYSKESDFDAEVMVGTEVQQTLAILVAVANPQITLAVGPFGHCPI